MTSSDSENTQNNNARFKPSRKFYVFLISLFLASAFWLLNALNKTYVEGVYIAIKYINLPSHRAFSPVPPKTIKIELSGDGYSLMQLMETAEEDTVVIDLADLEFESYGTRKWANIPTSVIIDELRSSLSNGVNVSRVNRDSINIVTEIGAELEYPVKPNFSISLEKGFVLVRPVYTIPELVMVKGAESAVNKIKGIETEHIPFEMISETEKKVVTLAYNHRFFQTNIQSVEIVAEVEPLTEGEIEVAIHVLGVPKNKRVRLIPNTIKIKYTTGLSHYDFIEAGLFDVSVNYQDVLLKSSKVQVNIVTQPSFVNVIHFLPERVDYLILDLAK